MPRRSSDHNGHDTSWTTAQRPTNPDHGTAGWNETLGYAETWDGIAKAWKPAAGVAKSSLDAAAAIVPTTNGTGEASKALVTDSSGNINLPTGTNLKARGEDVFDANGNIVASVPMPQGTTAEMAAIVLESGEAGYDTTLRQVKIGDGATAFSALAPSYKVPRPLAQRSYLAAVTVNKTTTTVSLDGSGMNCEMLGITAGQTLGIRWDASTGFTTITVNVVSASSFTYTGGSSIPAGTTTAATITGGDISAALQSGLLEMTEGAIVIDTQELGHLARVTFVFILAVITENSLALTYPVEFEGSPGLYGTAALVSISEAATSTDLYISQTTALSGVLIAEGIRL